MWALVPLKLLANAKQRLAGELSPEQRQLLVLAMASDVLRVLRTCEQIQHTLLISRNTEAAGLADRFNAELFAERAEADLPSALVEGVDYADKQGASGVCIIPADAPLINAADIDLLIAQHQVCTVVPDSACIGTNALVLTPPKVLGPIFDGSSFQPHLKAAVAARLPVTAFSSTSLGLDIDTPEDLAALQASQQDTDSKRYLSKLIAH